MVRGFSCLETGRSMVIFLRDYAMLRSYLLQGAVCGLGHDAAKKERGIMPEKLLLFLQHSHIRLV